MARYDVERRKRFVALRDRLVLGEPPYIKDAMGNMRRESGTPGLDELKAIGDYGPTASGIILALETGLQIIDDMLEGMR